jgi:catechol 2,3-dioxygenase-like lactoylglutathione lyase family enzyme
MSSAESAPPATATFEGVCPILRVRSLPASLAYYVDVLGFTVDWEDPDAIASVSRGRCCLFLTESEQGNPGSWVWIGVSDADALHDELRGRGAIIRNPPANFRWACEMQVADPDGNVLRMGSSAKPGVPYGPWRDGRGDLWLAQSDGSWVRDPSADARNA